MWTDEPDQPRLLIVEPRDHLRLQYLDCTVAVGFEVEHVQDPDQALLKAARLAPHIVLTECSPETGGLEYCRRLNHRLPACRIPVLGLIAEGDVASAEAAAAAGYTVLTKPCSPERLLVEIVRLLAYGRLADPMFSERDTRRRSII